jgi:hypothetical protein
MTSRLAPLLRHLTEGGDHAPRAITAATAMQDVLSPLKVSINTDKVRPPAAAMHGRRAPPAYTQQRVRASAPPLGGR